MKKIVASCTDGAASIMGENIGFNSSLKEKAPNCAIFHSMIHHQAPASKKLSIDLGDTLATVVRVVNFIKAGSTNHRLFAQLYEDEAHQTLLLHTEVRWLSRGKVLFRFRELKHKIIDFLINETTFLDQLTDLLLIKTAYLADISTLYNETNKKLQGRESNILKCKEAIEAFTRKLEYRADKMSQGNLQYF